MDPGSLQEIVLVVVLLVVYVLFSVAEVALVSVRRQRLKQLIEEGNRTAARIERLLEDTTRILVVSELGMITTGFIAVASATVIFAPRVGRWIAATPVPWLAAMQNVLGFLVVISVMSALVLIFGQLLPKRLARQYAERVAFAVAGPFEAFAWLTWPFAKPLLAVANNLSYFIGGEEAAQTSYVIEEEIRTIVEAGEEEGFIEEEERKMIYSIFEFGDTLTREVMVPRIDIVAVESDTPLLEALDVILRAGYTRIPVYTGTIDNVEGLLYAKDLLIYLRDGKTDVSLTDILRPAYFVPETKKLNELLEDMQQRKVHMAIVVDEYGGTAGLVTIEDILEEIVGEIQDEYDTEEAFIEYVGPGEVIFNARVHLDEVGELLGITLPTEGGDTLGGLIYNQLGRVPSVGDEVVVGRVKLSVLSVAGRRIKKVRATRLEAEQEEVKAVNGKTEGADNAREATSA